MPERPFQLLALFALILLEAACGAGAHGAGKKVLVLGVDGMDPGFVERHWSELPNLDSLRRSGSFQRLRTTIPPQSPVAWSTFITGTPPAEHGIFDFVHRDPATLQPFFSMSRTDEPHFAIPIGPYRIPLSSPRVVSLRKGKAFWETLAENGVPVTVMRMPTNYPPLKAGNALAGMGAPDLQGSQGTFSFFTGDPEEIDRAVPGGHVFKISVDQGHAVLRIPGPPNSLRKDESTAIGELTVDIDTQKPLVRLAVGGQLAILGEGEWSDWLSIEFPLIPHVATTTGMLRAFAKQVHPYLELYVSPINIDPIAPALPISNPKSFSRSVAEETGRFSTLGIPEDTSALRQGVFSLPEFLSQTHNVFEEERKLLRYSLRHFASGLLFFYFSTVDENSHILWGKHDSELLNVYREVDAAIGEARRANPDAELIVMSDHGFTSFDRAVNLNTWLYQRGFLGLKEAPGESANVASSADWPHTAAYALGLNALYVNLAGREKYGTVQNGVEHDAVIARLRDQLLAFRDPVNGKRVVEAVYVTSPDRSNTRIAPDLIVGYAPGYRASWQTGVGGIPADSVVDNDDPWIGDHCINPADVPGVLFTSRLAANQHPGLEDVTRLLLAEFGIPTGGRNAMPADIMVGAGPWDRR